MMKSNNNHPQGSHLHHHYLHNPTLYIPFRTNSNPPLRQRRPRFYAFDFTLPCCYSHGSALRQGQKKTYSTALTKLVLRVKKLAKIVLSDDEEIAEDSSKQERKISQIDEDPTISLVQDEELPKDKGKGDNRRICTQRRLEKNSSEGELNDETTRKWKEEVKSRLNAEDRMQELCTKKKRERLKSG
ncbi:hypothetical protein Tco_0710735 [Tanacetum coccineum]